MTRSATLVARGGRHKQLIARIVTTAALWLVTIQTTAIEPAAGFRELLEDSGVATNDLHTIHEDNLGENLALETLISRVLHRLNDVETGKLQPAIAKLDNSPALEAGQLYELRGTANRLIGPAHAGADSSGSERQNFFRIEVLTADDSRCLVITPEVPHAWKSRPFEAALSEPISCKGVFLGKDQDDQSCFLASHIAWHPEANVPAGLKWLSKQGYDAALLDSIRQGQPFAKHDDGAEARAFYLALAECGLADANELLALAQHSVEATANQLSAEASAISRRRQELAEQLSMASPQAASRLAEELKAVKTQEAIAQQAIKRGRQGLSSVWPMFLAAEGSVGEMFLFEGTARRAVRISVDEPGVALDEYFELDVFTTDSQNQPIICCVANLPEGFPTGDIIREPVRIAGIFFKRWAYSRRTESGAPEGVSLPARLASPLVLATAPVWLRKVESSAEGRGLLVGGVILMGAIALAAVLFRVRRGDRLAWDRRARYDALPPGPPSRETEPPPPPR